jgi:hypothetical protein
MTEITPYVSAIPPVRAQPVDQDAIVSVGFSTPINALVALVAAGTLYIL